MAEQESNTTDMREELINGICMYMISCGVDTKDAKNRLYLLMEPYEITNRCTELAELSEDRNEYLIKRFLVAKTVKGCSQKTIRMYRQGLQYILPRIGKTVDDITAEDIRYYLAVRQGRDHVSKVTADNELRILRTFYQYLVSEELVKKNPTVKVDRIKCDRKRKEALTDIEIEKIRMAAVSERERAVIETLLSTGCRVSELVGIQLNEIDGNKVLIHGKGAKERYCYLTAKAMLSIEVYLKERKDTNPYLFPGGTTDLVTKGKAGRNTNDSWWKNPNNVTKNTHLDNGTIEQMMRRIAKRAGVERANPHKFRRTCATMALRRGMPIEQVSRMLGHEELTTTQIYLDLTEDELAQAHKKYVV